MKIKPKKEFNFLPDEYFEVIAVSGYNYYLIQNEDLEFVWIDSYYFDKITAIGSELLIKERVNDFMECLVPNHLTKNNRMFEGKVNWNLKVDEFWDSYLFTLNMKAAGYKLNSITELLLNNFDFQYTMVEQQIHALAKTVQLLSDGYNFSIITIKKVPKVSPAQDEVRNLIQSFTVQGINRKVNKTEIGDLYDNLTNVFDMSLSWLSTFTVCPKMFEDKYWLNKLSSMIQTSINNLFIYSQVNSLIATRYELEERDAVFIQLESEKHLVTLGIQNSIH